MVPSFIQFTTDKSNFYTWGKYGHCFEVFLFLVGLPFFSFFLEVVSLLIKTRLNSIESRPKKVVVVVVVVILVVVVVVIIVGHRNLTLKFGQNWVNTKWSIVVVVIVLVLFLLLIKKPSLKLGPNQVNNNKICCCCFGCYMFCCYCCSRFVVFVVVVVVVVVVVNYTI